MIALAMVVLDVLGDRAPEMALAEGHDPTEAFLLDRAYEAFGVGVRVRRLRGSAHDLDPDFTPWDTTGTVQIVWQKIEP